jgi:hypothetical protein
MTKQEHLRALLEQVEAKFGRGLSSNWKNRDFEDLNFEINKKTKTVISALTLKRIFGKIKTADDYLPQKATIKALEQYANFVLRDSKPAVELNENTLTTPLNETIIDNINSKKTSLRKFILLSSLVIIVFFGYFIFLNYSSSTNNTACNISLSKTDGFNPKTAFFEYSTSNNVDSFFVWYDESFKPIYVPNGKKMKSSYYFQYPGLYNVRITNNKKESLSDTIQVLVETKGWQALGYYFDQKYNERFFPIDVKKSTRFGSFHPSKTDVSDVGMDTSKISVIRLDNFRTTQTNGDNFTLETTVKNPDKWSGIRCNSIFLYVVGKLGTIRFRFANPGCSYWIDYKLSEKLIDNQKKDLTNFTFDLGDWQKFKIENREKKIKLFVNNSLIFTDSYVRSIGSIVGVSVLFHGNGFLKNYTLMDQHQQTVFAFQP